MSLTRKVPKRPFAKASYRTVPATPKRRKLSTREDRAKSPAKVVLRAAKAHLASKQNHNPEYESEVRAIVATTRQALDEGKSTHEAIRDVFTLVFRVEEPAE